MSSYLDIRELLSKYGFDGDNLPIIKGSARQALKKMIANLKTTLDGYRRCILYYWS